jgi:DHA1 family inner membrane transport protein
MNYRPLMALALATFGMGSAEFVIQGLSPEFSGDLSVTIPTAGLLVTGYALGVAIGGPIMVVLVNRLAPKTALISLLGLFVLGNVLSAIAPNYGLVLAARIIASFCHGAYFGIALVVAASIVPENRRASAISLIFGGLTIANILGVPAGTALGQAFGWRASFWAVSLVGTAAIAAIATWLPKIAPGQPAGLAKEFKVLG